MQHLLLLHGAIGSKDQLTDLEKELASSFTVHRLNFKGHGDEPIGDENFSIELFARQVLAFLEEKSISSVSIVGYSMGGYVAMYLARFHPAKIEKVVTLATKFIWDEAIAAREVKMLDAKKLEEKVPAFAQELKQRHSATGWIPVLEKTIALLTGLGADNPLTAEDFSLIQTPVLLLSGDKDKMVVPEETLQTYKLLPAAQLGILPGTPHPIEQVKTAVLAAAIRQFLN